MADAVDAVPGDGACATAAGACALRAAIQEANALSGPDTVTLPAGTFTLTIPGTREDLCATGDLDVQDDLTIIGADASSTTIDGGGLDAILGAHVCRLTLSGLTLTGGSSEIGGAIYALGSLFTATDCNFVLNQSRIGGAIAFQVSTVAITNCIFDRNRADDPLIGLGGALYAGDETTGSVDATVFMSNHAAVMGGAIALASGQVLGNHLILRRVTISRCDTSASGGAVGVVSDGSPSSVLILGSTLSENHADGRGGAIFVDVNAEVSLQIGLVNCTLSGNSAARGGAVWLGPRRFGGDEGAHFEAYNSTIASNDAPVAAGIDAPDGSIAELGRTILFGNTGGSDCEGSIVSLGRNLFGSVAPCAITGDTTTNLLGVDPLLGPLQDNGGPTFTHELLAGSPAIDAAADTCVDDAGVMLVADQRGSLRPGDGDGDTIADCDIGAYEACGADIDGDTLGDLCDCAPGDPTSVRVPAEADLRVVEDAATGDAILSWVDLAPRAGSGTRYDVASGSVGALWTSRRADAPCVATGITGPWIDARAVADRGWYYLVRGINACGPPMGEGWGSDSRGVRRPACP